MSPNHGWNQVILNSKLGDFNGENGSTVGNLQKQNQKSQHVELGNESFQKKTKGIPYTPPKSTMEPRKIGGLAIDVSPCLKGVVFSGAKAVSFRGCTPQKSNI